MRVIRRGQGIRSGSCSLPVSGGPQQRFRRQTLRQELDGCAAYSLNQYPDSLQNLRSRRRELRGGVRRLRERFSGQWHHNPRGRRQRSRRPASRFGRAGGKVQADACGLVSSKPVSQRSGRVLEQNICALRIKVLLGLGFALTFVIAPVAAQAPKDGFLEISSR